MPRKMHPLLDSTGELSARPLSPRERLVGLLAGNSKPAYQGLMGLLGQSPAATPEAQARDMINPLGGLLGMYDAGQDLGKGDYLAGGIGLLGVAPGGRAAKKAIRAYHGSPHDFDKFSMDKIGTGEGAQSYGHGLYFAENEGVARSYKDALANDVKVRGMKIDTILNTTEMPLRDIDRRALQVIQLTNGQNPVQYADELIAQGKQPPEFRDVVKAWAQDVDSVAGGRMYEVEINADPDSFLDWDKPLSEQSPHVQEVFRPVAENRAVYIDPKDWTTRVGTPQYGNQLYDAYAASLGSRHKQDAASEALRQAGIPGIKYLDQGSRTVGDGTRNYVVFDDSIISIVRKFGIAGALAAGAISQSDAQELSAQGYQ